MLFLVKLTVSLNQIVLSFSNGASPFNDDKVYSMLFPRTNFNDKKSFPIFKIEKCYIEMVIDTPKYLLMFKKKL